MDSSKISSRGGGGGIYSLEIFPWGVGQNFLIRTFVFSWIGGGEEGDRHFVDQRVVEEEMNKRILYLQ